MDKKDIISIYGKEYTDKLERLVRHFHELKLNEQEIYNIIKPIDSCSRAGLKMVCDAEYDKKLSDTIDSINYTLNQNIMDAFEDSVKNNYAQEYLESINMADAFMLKNTYESKTFENDKYPNIKNDYSSKINYSIKVKSLRLQNDKKSQFNN